MVWLVFFEMFFAFAVTTVRATDGKPKPGLALSAFRRGASKTWFGQVGNKK